MPRCVSFWGFEGQEQATSKTRKRAPAGATHRERLPLPRNRIPLLPPQVITDFTLRMLAEQAYFGLRPCAPFPTTACSSLRSCAPRSRGPHIFRVHGKPRKCLAMFPLEGFERVRLIGNIPPEKGNLGGAQFQENFP